MFTWRLHRFRISTKFATRPRVCRKLETATASGYTAAKQAATGPGGETTPWHSLQCPFAPEHGGGLSQTSDAPFWQCSGRSIHVSFQGVSGHFPRSFRIFSPLFHILSTGGRHDGAATGASGDHPRPSRSRTFVRITILRITATSATLWALPAAVSRSYSSLIAGFQRMAVIAAM